MIIACQLANKKDDRDLGNQEVSLCFSPPQNDLIRRWWLLKTQSWKRITFSDQTH
jgi:hypothetical protein